MIEPLLPPISAAAIWSVEASESSVTRAAAGEENATKLLRASSVPGGDSERPLSVQRFTPLRHPARWIAGMRWWHRPSP